MDKSGWSGPRLIDAHLEPQGFLAMDPAFVNEVRKEAPFRGYVCLPPFVFFSSLQNYLLYDKQTDMRA